MPISKKPIERKSIERKLIKRKLIERKSISITPKANKIIARKQVIRELTKAKVSDYEKLIKKIPLEMISELIIEIRKFGVIDKNVLISPHKFEELLQQLSARQLKLKREERKNKK